MATKEERRVWVALGLIPNYAQVHDLDTRCIYEYRYGYWYRIMQDDVVVPIDIHRLYIKYGDYRFGNVGGGYNE